MFKISSFSLVLFLFSIKSFALTATQIAQTSYNVNHSLYIKNMMIKKKKRSAIVVVGRVKNSKPKVMAIERFLTNEYATDVVEAKDLVIVRSGALKGLGILMTSYNDPKRSHTYLMWIPALRKVRRMAEPKDAGLGAGDIAFLEDAKLRRFHEESYELVETKQMDLELKMMPFKKGELGRYGKNFPYKERTLIKDRTIHVLKSTFKEKGHWYDHRISYIDSEYFTDYKTDYYKDGMLIKHVYRHWTDLDGVTDPKAKMWYYWYSKDTKTGYEMTTYIPKKLMKVNQKAKKSFWSEQTLKKIKR